MILRQYGGWSFDWGLTALSTQIRSYRAFKAIEYFDEKLHLNACPIRSLVCIQDLGLFGEMKEEGSVDRTILQLCHKTQRVHPN